MAFGKLEPPLCYRCPSEGGGMHELARLATRAITPCNG